MNLIRLIRHGQTPWLACWAFVGCLLTSPVWAGPLPMPLEAHLDLAKDVVCGEVVELEPVADERQGHVHYANATIAISETLKGKSKGKIMVRVVVKVDPEYEGNAILHAHRLGDAGIWVIDSAGAVDHSYGMLSLDRKAKVHAMLKDLAERKWSEPVEGVQIWAKQVDAARRPAFLLAVRNNSKENVYFPVSTAHGFVQLTQLTTKGEQTSYVHRSGGEKERVFCHQLAPGEIRYIHPAYSFISIPPAELIARDTFQVVLSCQNTNPLGEAAGRGPASQVRAWCGSLRTEPIDVVLSKK